MKYIKQYDNHQTDLKKYVIWHYKEDNIDDLEILEIVIFDGQSYFTQSLYSIEDNKLIEKKFKQLILAISPKDVNLYIVYTSDNLQDCIDMILILKNVEKYNL